MSTYGLQCDAITNKGRRCTRQNTREILCMIVRDARCTSYDATKYKTVRLCSCHAHKENELRRENKRLKLHHGGHLGAYNRYHYGNLVTVEVNIDWDKVKKLTVPKYWTD
jgi:hypothetical protein